MRKIFGAIFNFIAKFIAVIFSVLFVITSILVLLLTSFDHTLLQAATYKNALAKSAVYDKLPSLVTDQFSQMKEFLADPCKGNQLVCAIDGASPELQACLIESLGGEETYEKIGSGQRKPTELEVKSSQSCLDQYGDPAAPLATEDGSPSADQQQSGDQMAFLENLSPDEIEMFLQQLLPPDEAQEMTETTLDQLFAYLNGKTDTVKMSLVKLKAHLIGQAGEDLFLLLLNAQPPCTKEQEAEINSVAPDGEEQTLVFCAATGETLDSLMFDLQNQLNDPASQIPDEAILVKPPSPSDSPSGGPLGNDPHAALQKINTTILLSPLLPLTLLLLVSLFGVRSLKGWLRWWGIPLFIAGLIPLSIGVAALLSFEWVWAKFGIPNLPVLLSTPSLVALGHDIAQSIVHDLSTQITLEAGLITLLGLGAIIGSYYIKPRTSQPAQATVSPALSS